MQQIGFAVPSRQVVAVALNSQVAHRASIP
jgi:hypothetical protein